MLTSSGVGVEARNVIFPPRAGAGAPPSFRSHKLALLIKGFRLIPSFISSLSIAKETAPFLRRLYKWMFAFTCLSSHEILLSMPVIVGSFPPPHHTYPAYIGNVILI